MRIDMARSVDGDAVVALLGDQFREHGIRLSAHGLSEAVLGMLADPARGTILLAYDPEPVGVAVLAYTWTLEHGGLVAWLDELFVAPDRRDRGTGRALLERALEIAGARGCRAVDLEVDADHTRAESLYRRQGFAPLARRRWTKRL